MTKQTRQTMIEMLPGIFIYEVILAIILFFLAPHIQYTGVSMLCGVAVGTLVTLAALWDMARTVEDTVSSQNEAYANRKTLIHSILRKIVLIVLLIVFWRSTIVNVVAVILSALGLKPGAYMQPYVHRLLHKDN